MLRPWQSPLAHLFKNILCLHEPFLGLQPQARTLSLLTIIGPKKMFGSQKNVAEKLWLIHLILSSEKARDGSVWCGLGKFTHRFVDIGCQKECLSWSSFDRWLLTSVQNSRAGQSLHHVDPTKLSKIFQKRLERKTPNHFTLFKKKQANQKITKPWFLWRSKLLVRQLPGPERPSGPNLYIYFQCCILAHIPGLILANPEQKSKPPDTLGVASELAFAGYHGLTRSYLRNFWESVSNLLQQNITNFTSSPFVTARH